MFGTKLQPAAARRSAALALAIAALAPASAYADNYCAATTVRSVNVRESGEVHLSLDVAPTEKNPGEGVTNLFRHQMICDLDTVVNGISTETCKQWLHLLTVAHLSGRKVVLYHTNVTVCRPAATWGNVSANLTYIELGNHF